MSQKQIIYKTVTTQKFKKQFAQADIVSDPVLEECYVNLLNKYLKLKYPDLAEVELVVEGWINENSKGFKFLELVIFQNNNNRLQKLYSIKKPFNSNVVMISNDGTETELEKPLKDVYNYAVNNAIFKDKQE